MINYSFELLIDKNHYGKKRCVVSSIHANVRCIEHFILQEQRFVFLILHFFLETFVTEITTEDNAESM